MIIKNSEFTISAVKEAQYPTEDLSQIVLVGKSNVGKSSFINTIVNRKKLARTSSEPGKTRLINFYKIFAKINKPMEEKNENVNNNESKIENKNEIELTEKNKKVDNSNLIEKQFYFVDLPGYGFSKMSKEEQVRVGKFIEEYLQKCKKISLVVFLIDIRHEPTADDKLMYKYIISQGLPCIVVANKADKIAVTKVNAQVESLQKILNPLHDLKFFPFSSERKVYTEDVMNEIEKYVN